MSWTDTTQRSRKLYLVQGEFKVSEDPQDVITTLVGSCVTACLYDPIAKVGGMNHFLLPHGPCGGNDTLYGINQMELLINGLLRMGARKYRMKSKLFGGNTITAGLCDAGVRNAEMAETFLSDENIPCVASALRGTQAQRIQFHPATGRARMKYIEDTFEGDRAQRPAPVAAPVDSGVVELF
ncbi:MAG: chemotaxis protein CheD [Litorimonas sp.]